MKKSLFILSFIVLSQTIFAQRFHNQKIVGYVTDYRSSVNVDYANLTHAVYAFLPLNDDGTIGEIDENTFKTFLDESGKYGTKRMVSLNSDLKFLAENPKALSKFADTLVKFCKLKKIDGVDIDWEGLSSSQDSLNYALMMDTLDLYLHKEKLLLACTVPMSDYWGHWFDNAALKKADWLNIMVYDAAGTWKESPFENHSTFDHLVQADMYWTSRGFKKDSLVMGVPFYGHKFKTIMGGIAQAKTYQEIVSLYPLMNDTCNFAPDGLTFFNGPALIRKKTQYLIDNKFGGIMIWEMAQDARGMKSLHRQIVCTYNNMLCSTIRDCPEKSITNGLVSSWNFNGDLKDEVGGNNGTFSGPTFTTDKMGNTNQAVSFAEKTYIYCGAAQNLNLDEFTISAWTNVNAWGGWRDIVFKYQNDTIGSYDVAINDSKAVFYGVDTDNKVHHIKGRTIIEPNKWNHITVSHSFNDGIKIYLNGNLEIHDTTHFNLRQNEKNYFYMGGYYTGKIDEVKVFNKVLSQCDIDSLVSDPLNKILLGFENVDVTKNVSVFPNPSTGNVRISLSELTKSTTISISNIIGEQIDQFDAKEQEINYQFNQPDGIYFIRINSGNHSMVKKVVIQNSSK